MTPEQGPFLVKLSYFLVALVGALVPLAFRKGLSKFQAGVMVVCGTIGAGVLTHPVAMFAHQYLPGTYEDIDHSVAFVCGVLVMRVSEEALRFIGRYTQKAIDKT